MTEAHSIEPARACPFCGSENVQFEKSEPVRGQWTTTTYYWLNCLGCDATGPSATLAAEALRLWNGRRSADRMAPG